MFKDYKFYVNVNYKLTYPQQFPQIYLQEWNLYFHIA